MLLHDDVIEEYRDFAAYAAGDSPCFEAWAAGVTADPEVLAWLDTLPPVKRQPNLVFAAARWHGAPAPGPYAGLRRVLLEQEAEVRTTVMSRATQTNEVGRLATLVPVLATIEGPVALVEVGASAGLCLYPDRYDYAWPPRGDLRGSGGPVLTAEASGPLPVPASHPRVAWRGGVDLNPLDVSDPDAMAWLENLVWPEQDERRQRLRTAVDVARTDPPALRTGDLFDHLPGLLEEAAAARDAGGVPLCGHRLPRGAGPAPVPRPDDRPGRGRSLPLDQQRGTSGAARAGRGPRGPLWPVRDGAGRRRGGVQPRPRARDRLAQLTGGESCRWGPAH